jgi:hypothetical protein
VAVGIFSAIAAVALGRWAREQAVVLGSAAPRRPDPRRTAPAAGTRAPLAPRPILAGLEQAGTGEAEIVGVLVDGAGVPIADAVVAALVADPARGAAAPSALTVTRADGAFVLRGLAAGPYRLQVTGGPLFRAEVGTLDVPGAPVRVLAMRRVAVAGRVTFAEAPTAGATVMLRGGDASDARTAVTDAQGAFAVSDLYEGRYQVWAFQGDHASAAVVVERFGAESGAPLVLALEPASIVTGRVVAGPTGLGVAARVVLRDEAEREPPRLIMTDGDGRFRIPGVVDGRWLPSAEAEGMVAVEELTFETPRTRDVTISLWPGAVVSGIVVDDHGAAVVGAALTVRGVDLADRPVLAGPVAPVLGRGSSRLIARGELGVLVGPVPPLPAPGSRFLVAWPLATPSEGTGAEPRVSAAPLQSDRAGRFRVGGLPPGEYTVSAHHPDFAAGESAPFSATLGREVGPIAIRLVVADAEIAGRVVDPLSFPVAGARVLVADGAVAARGRATTADADGRFVLVDVPAGRFTLAVEADGYPPAQAVVTTDAPATVTLAFGGGVRVDVRDAHTGAAIERSRLSGQGPGGGGERSLDLRGGTGQLVGLPAGVWRLHVDAGGYVAATTTVRVPAGDRPGAITVDDLRIDLRRGAQVAGVVVDRHGVRVAGARVSVGDVATTSDADGAFRLDDVPTGQVFVGAELGAARGQVAIALRPGDLVVTLQIALE